MSIFAPDAFPQWLRIILFWIGVALLLAGTVGGLWHFRPKGWFDRHVRWRFRRLPPDTQTPDIALVGPGAEMHGEAAIIKPPPEGVLERLLHTCYVLASVEHLKSRLTIEFIVVAYNASPKTLIVADIVGGIRCTVNDEEGRQVYEPLGTPELVRLAPKRQIPPFTEFAMTLNEAVSPRQAERILTTMKKKTVTVDLEDLNITFSPYQEVGPVARLKLWDGVGLHTASGPRSGRATIVKVQGAALKIGGAGTLGSEAG